MKQRLAFAALFVAVFCAAPVLAQCRKTCQKAKTDTAKSEGKACSHSEKTCAHGHGEAHHQHAKDAKTAMCPSEVTCDGDRVQFQGVDIPRIGFKVGGKLTCCMKSAREMAAGDATKIKFAIADKTCDSLAEAQTARLKVLEDYYADVLTVKYAVGDECVGCPLAAKDKAKACGKPVRYRLAAFDFVTKVEAEKAAEAARAAGDKISMSWVVGEKTFACPKHAAEAAESTDQDVEYRIGDQTTPCETTAKTRLIEARITAAIELLAKTAQR